MGYNMKSFPKDAISSFLKYNRSKLGLKQEELAKRAGVGIRFLRELEQGKESLKMDKVNQVLRFFGYCLSPVAEKTPSPYSIQLNGTQKKIKLYLGKNKWISGTLVGFQTKNGQVLRWKIVADEFLKEYKRTNHPSLVQFAEHVDIEKWEPEDAFI
jgi:y4mF family transcriptional regulator